MTIGTQRDTAIAFSDRTDGGAIAVRVWTPRDTDGVTPRPLVIWSHPQGQTQQVIAGYFAYTLVHAWLNAGYMVIASANAGPNGWSSAASEASLLSAYNYVNSSINPVSKVVLAGASMGCSVSPIALANGTVPNVKGAILIDPACSMSNFYANASYTSSLDTGFGITRGTLSAAMASTGLTSVPTTASYPTVGTLLLLGNGTANVETVTTTAASTGTTVAVSATTKTHASADQVSDFPTKTLNRDPVSRPASNYSGKRYLIISGAADTTAPHAANADVLAALIATGSPTEVTTLSHPGAHLVAACATPKTTVQFLARCFA